MINETIPFDLDSNIIEFDDTDPYNPKNTLKGYVNRTQGQLYGSLYITHVNNTPCPQTTYLSSEQHCSKKYQNYKWLKHKYVDEKQSTYQIAEECNVTQEAIHYWVSKFKIKKPKPKYKDYEWFYNKYINEKFTVEEIGKLCECGKTTIWRWFRKHQLPPRSHSEAQKLCTIKQPYMYYDWLYKKYIKEKRSSMEIGKICNVSDVTILNWLQHLEIPIRTNSEAHAGCLSYSWKGDKVGYTALHNWVRKQKPKPKYCEICGNVPPRDLSNNDGKYKRDINNYQWLCRKCHGKKDRYLRKKLKRKNTVPKRFGINR